MKVVKRAKNTIKKEEAHGGSGSKKVYVDSTHLSNPNIEAMTHGYLPAGQSFDWHEHANTDEVMVVMYGSGVVSDEDGSYEYAEGDVFVFPANTSHKIHNPSDEEHQMIFTRIKR